MKSIKRTIMVVLAMLVTLSAYCTGFCCEGYYGYDSNESYNYNIRGNYVRIEGGNCNVRTGPGKSYADIGTLSNGSVCEYAGCVATDYRGVAWYEIYYYGSVAWVSSRYSRLM